MVWSLQLCLVCLSLFANGLQANPVTVNKITDDGYNIQMNVFGKTETFNVQKASETVLSSGFQILNADVNQKGDVVFNRWVPSEEELITANEIYLGSEKAIFKIHEDTESGEVFLNGVAGDISVVHDGQYQFASRVAENKSDYIDLQRKISFTKAKQNGPVDAVVEIVIVCDKEFGDVFNHDSKRILDYLTVFMWDLNLRYKTLPSDNISFRVNGILVISDIAAQPFIEEARAPDGRAEFGRILEKYSYWVYSQRDNLPKFDMAPLITNTQLEWGGGLAYMNAACWVDTTLGRNLGTAVFNDGGGWGSLTVAVHELGHNLGAPHDDDENFPGGCSDRGFIMGGGNDDYRYFFSECSDRMISAFVRSDSAACLRTIEGPSNPIIDPSYSNPKAPTMEEHCKRVLNDDTAYMEIQDTFNCKSMRCLRPGDDGVIWIHNIAPVENVMCGDSGRCFRGRCRQQGHIFRNVGSGLCMKASNPFVFTAQVEMIPCPGDGTPLERFVITESNNGILLGSPYTNDSNRENGDKCLYTGNGEGGAIWTDICNSGNPYHGWDFQDVGNNMFLLKHRITNRCAKPFAQSVGSNVGTYGACDSNDANMRWTRHL